MLLITLFSDEYRYGFQGQEKDDEVKGEGNSYTTQFRQLDPRLGRWLSLDPMARKYPNQSPYISMDDNPILKNDVLGLYGSERRANRKKAKAEKKGWSTGDVYSVGEGKNKDYRFNATIIDSENERDVTFTASKTNQFGKRAIKKAGGWNDWASENAEAWAIPNDKPLPVIGNISISKTASNNSVYSNKQNGILPEISSEAKFGVDLATGLAYSTAEETMLLTKSKAAQKSLSTISKSALKVNTAVTIIDKGSKTANALMNEEWEEAGHHSVTGTGYIVAGAMMASPTGISQVVGAILFIGVTIYDVIADPEPKK